MLGPSEPPINGRYHTRKRKRDPRSWETEEACRGEALGTGLEGKGLPAHLRQSHRNFVENISCDSCSAVILERCEQCSIIMHCQGCRKTLCASCAFDRPYLRNLRALEADRNKFWFAPGYAVSPCSMLDADPMPIAPGGNPNALVPNIGPSNLTLRWCCVEPVFSGGGGITFYSGAHNGDVIRAAPIGRGLGWEDAEFQSTSFTHTTHYGPGRRWSSIDAFFRRDDMVVDGSYDWSVPRNLCDDCYASEDWRITCKACQSPICVRHDVCDKLRARLCGYQDLTVEKNEYKKRQKAQKSKAEDSTDAHNGSTESDALPDDETRRLALSHSAALSTPQIQPSSASIPRIAGWTTNNTPSTAARAPSALVTRRVLLMDDDTHGHRGTSDTSSTASPSRASSPASSETSSIRSLHAGAPEILSQKMEDNPPDWRGCQSFVCPTIRAPGDHRRRCGAAVRQCLDCKINVCGDCVSTLEANCDCSGCRQPTFDENNTATSNTPATGSDAQRFFCPNCRWKRRHKGLCKRRIPGSHVAKPKKGQKPRKPFKDRVPYGGPSHTANALDDPALEMTRDFFDSMTMSNEDRAARSPSLSEEQALRSQQDSLTQRHLNDGNDVIAVDDTVQDIAELEDMGALARNLIDRIQSLRRQIRPPTPMTVNLVVSASRAPTPPPYLWPVANLINELDTAIVGFEARRGDAEVAGGVEGADGTEGAVNIEDAEGATGAEETQGGGQEERPAVDGMD